jgi:hypothetical protein
MLPLAVPSAETQGPPSTQAFIAATQRTNPGDASPFRRLQDCTSTPSPVNVGRWTAKPQLAHDCAMSISYICKRERRSSWSALCRGVVLVEITHLLPSLSTPITWFKLHQGTRRNDEEFCFEMPRPMQRP